MSIESRDGLKYEGPGADEIPDDVPPRKRSRKMAKPKTDAPASPKQGRTGLEVFQTVVIAILITAIAAFIGGMQFEKSRQAELQSAVKAAQTTVAPAPEAAKK